MATATKNLVVHGMTCGNCAQSVEKKLSATPGVVKVTVDLAGANATVEYDTDLVTPEAIETVVRDLGYEVPA
jgi:copper chaperone CopZ